MGVRFPSRSILASALALALPSAAAAGGVSFPVPASAVAVAAPDAVKPRVEVRLLIDPTPAPGRIARVGALFTLDPGWHLYWRNPGDAGLPTRVRWRADGAELGPLAWPAPEVFRDAEAGLTSYGYSGAVLLASDLGTLGPRSGPRELHAEAEFLVCKDQCIPGKVSLARDLDGALAGGSSAARIHDLFEQFAAQVPLPAEKLGVEVGVGALELAERAGAPLRARLRVDPCARRSDPADGECAVESAAFVPDASPGLSLSDASGGASAGAFELAVEGRATEDGARREARLAGVLELRAHDGRVRAVALDLPLDPGAAAQGSGAGASFATAFLLAALGGAILNLMPCVLPVLALKVFALAELGRQSRRQTLAHALGYFAGVELTLLALATGVIALRAAGSYVGWGFQFQEPRFALAITLLLVGFALNLFGVFEIGSPTALGNVGADASGVARSFFDGLLAVVLATPCSAPFLGTAVGFAFAGSALNVLVIFAAIGFGLAAPLSLVAVAPGVAARMPRSGPWMGKLRVGLGFALLASAIWTLWIFGRTAGIDALGAALGLALALALAAWVFGVFQASERAARGLAIAAAIALVAGVALRSAWQGAAPPPAEGAQASAAHGAWQRFDPDAIAGQLRAGRPVFVDFTAAWCLTCAVNERAVIASARVQDELARRDFALFRADWTLRDESIRRELARFGRAGVPLYVVYDPAAPGEPRVLSELLTVDALVEALRERGGRGA
ncbi:MAG TPA: thioredoxin family protein [Myxococcota bacterium]|nr:thioredoxin family protein [Myxococcota bacterium]